MIRSFFDLAPFASHYPCRELIAHVRWHDYGPKHRIHPDWYRDIIREEHLPYLTVVCPPEDVDTVKKEFSEMEGYYFNIHSRGVYEDFKALFESHTLIMANSTFSWWAAFLGNPVKIYKPKQWLPIPEVNLTGFPGAIELDNKMWE